jgi:hypothetical protein
MGTATFTDLLRRPNDVAAQAESGAVRITRRDAEDLVLLRAGDLERQDRGIALASRLMRATFAHQGDMLAALRDVFAWTSVFSPQGQQEFATIIEKLLWSAAELGVYGGLIDEIVSWEGTAEAIADGLEPVAILPSAQWVGVEQP